MKINYFAIIIYFFFQFDAYANDRETKLNQLFRDLKENNSVSILSIEKKIWELWSTHPSDEKLTAKLQEGSILLMDQKLLKAKKIFSEIINLDESWAEAWNKRATVLYLLGEYEKSQEDIDKVLNLENRHFGALAGQGLVNIQLKNYEKAILSYEKAKQIYPSMKSNQIMIDKIKELIKRNSI